MAGGTNTAQLDFPHLIRILLALGIPLLWALLVEIVCLCLRHTRGTTR